MKKYSEITVGPYWGTSASGSVLYLHLKQPFDLDFKLNKHEHSSPGLTHRSLLFSGFPITFNLRRKLNVTHQESPAIVNTEMNVT